MKEHQKNSICEHLEKFEYVPRNFIFSHARQGKEAIVKSYKLLCSYVF